ncbi:MAG: HAMP domain-containing methyl-accepting chemotaxis protein [Chloroflexi bacterium]|nr:HAMP domain-containing methyl-accepting chemotaxis protein [Chloroflexota bacterium]
MKNWLLRRLDIKTKLVGGFAIVTILLLVTTGVSWSALRSLRDASDVIVHERLPEVEEARDLELQVALQAELFLEYGLTLDEEVLANAKARSVHIEEEAAQLERQLVGQPELLAILIRFETEYEEWGHTAGEFAHYAAIGDTTGELEMLHQLFEEEELMEAELKELIDRIDAEVEHSFENASQTYTSALWIMGAITLVAFAAAVAIGLGLALSISRNVGKVSIALKRIAEGDLSYEVKNDSYDELGDMSRSYEFMRSYVKEVATAAESIREGDLGISVAPKSQVDVLGHAVAGMITNLKARADIAGEIAQGNLNVKNEIASDRDVLGKAFEAMITNLRERASVADEIARGNLGVRFSSLSQQDLLGNAFVSMVDNLKERAQVAERIAQGDLTVEFSDIAADDVLGNAFELMGTNLRSAMGKVSVAATTLTNSSVELSSAADQAGQATQEIAMNAQRVASGAETQGQAVQATRGGIAQLLSAIEQVAESSQDQARAVNHASEIVRQVSEATQEVNRNADEATQGSGQAAEAAEAGRVSVRKTVEGMDRIRSAMDTASTRIEELGKHSAEIGKIVSVIDDIAAQTNLLALNAAIEAARAGEQGRGFAVVADEVRKLAERVTTATGEIASLVDTVQIGVAESVKAANEGSAEVEAGAALANEAGEALSQILEAVALVNGQVAQISTAAQQVSASSDEMVQTIDSVSQAAEQNSAAAEEMTAGSTEVGQTVEEVAEVTEQNRGVTEETSAAAEQLSAQVEEVVAASQSLARMGGDLVSVVNSFKLSKDDELRSNLELLAA